MRLEFVSGSGMRMIASSGHPRATSIAFSQGRMPAVGRMPSRVSRASFLKIQTSAFAICSSDVLAYLGSGVSSKSAQRTAAH